MDATEETGRYGRLINHSLKNPNCATKVRIFVKINLQVLASSISGSKVVPLEDSPRLLLIAKHDIEVGVELLFDYGERDQDIIESNPWLAE